MLMEEVSHTIPSTDSDGLLEAESYLSNYPPRIFISITTPASLGDGRSRYFTKKERIAASELCMRMTRKARKRYPWLVIKNEYPQPSFGRTYIIKPKDYEQASKIMESQVRCYAIERNQH